MIFESEFDVDEIVYDTLTNTETRIIGISYSLGFTNGNTSAKNIGSFGYWVDNDYLSGGRHPWEISKI